MNFFGKIRVRGHKEVFSKKRIWLWNSRWLGPLGGPRRPGFLYRYGLCRSCLHRWRRRRWLKWLNRAGAFLLRRPFGLFASELRGSRLLRSSGLLVYRTDFEEKIFSLIKLLFLFFFNFLFYLCFMVLSQF